MKAKEISDYFTQVFSNWPDCVVKAEKAAKELHENAKRFHSMGMTVDEMNRLFTRHF